ncbi:Asp23/Gls24 family envelope stress response protein [Salicibibacter halophilus]|uniref:Asp23/Gls24 family envelope stress response protein n=1 Tax=Salicibibacter halophilus TaxID=2502791 RepID=A0A514LDD7_9BACI|nr:Asp23/Gls24 family envelope stress response protein [Salicibibacter halophilus]QDI89868.1 Asp23/Gls24 family envelope stress response protein [Salicibibacter halophilus]
MSEYQMLDIEEQENDLGKVEISPEVIEVIAGLATSEVEGIAALRGNLATDVAERFGRKNHGKGVKVELGDDGVVIDVSIVANYGISVPDVANQVQRNIQQALETMTSIAMDKINVHVVGIQFEQPEEQQGQLEQTTE